jgi:hypothetical protein
VGEPMAHESNMEMQLWPSQDLTRVGLAAAPVGGSPPSVGEKEEGDAGGINVR